MNSFRQNQASILEKSLLRRWESITYLLRSVNVISRLPLRCALLHLLTFTMARCYNSAAMKGRFSAASSAISV